MKIIVIHKLKNRMLQLMRMMFVLAILFILIIQLVETIKAVDWKSHPYNDNSQWVDIPISTNHDMEKGFLDQLLDKLRDYHRGEKIN